MSLDPSPVAPVSPGAAPALPVWKLAAWWAAVAAGLAAFRATDASLDYKNSAVFIAALLATAGASIWTLRNARGSRARKWTLAMLTWTPLWAISPAGPIKLILNGNVGYEGWRWRWLHDPDELLKSPEGSGKAIAWHETSHDYPAFLGGGHWAEVEGVELDPDWSARRPKELWRQPIGAGWSSYAVVGDYAVTQEQRGPNELVVCYDIRTGEVAWSHADSVRWDPGGSGALGAVGPRATPTLVDSRVYAHGATGLLNCLDARTGDVIWSHDTLAEHGAENVLWGKAGSPLIVDDWVVVSVGGSAGHSLVAYDRQDGEEVWAAGDQRSSYATPVLTELDGLRQIVVVNENFVTGHRAADGHAIWEYPWLGDSDSNASASNPMPIGDNRLLLSKGYGIPAEVIEVSQTDGAWSAARVWQKPTLRTKMSNVVVRDGYAYGIDDVDLACVELATGQRKWKSRRRPSLGNGQIMLVGEHILAVSESGEVMLVAATPSKYQELASFQAIEGDRVWNNPALAGPFLLVRDAQEAACFELPLRRESPGN